MSTLPHFLPTIQTGSSDNESVQILFDKSLIFKYSTLEKATGSFAEANKLGRGGFGTVYKVILPFIHTENFWEQNPRKQEISSQNV